MSFPENQLKDTLQNLLLTKAEIKGTTLITYIVSGSTDS